MLKKKKRNKRIIRNIRTLFETDVEKKSKKKTRKKINNRLIRDI